MTILVRRYLYCDGGSACESSNEPFQLDGSGQTAAEQRRMFYTEGWHYWRALDLCPHCWPRRHEIASALGEQQGGQT